MRRENTTSKRVLSVALIAAAISVLLAVEAYAQTWADVRRVGPFICRADFMLTGLESVLAELAWLQEDVVEQLKIPPVKDSIEVLLFQDERGYRRYVNQYYAEVPYRRALYIKRSDSVRVLAYQSDRLLQDLQHEGTHALLHASLPMIPLWLDEGLAEYFERPRNGRALNGAGLKSVRRAVWLGLFTSMESLEAKTDIAKMGEREYRDAWVWVHFMLHGAPEVHDELVQFLSDIHDRTPPGKLSQRLYDRAGPLRPHFLAYLSAL